MTEKAPSDRWTTRVMPEGQIDRPLIRRRSLTAVNRGGMRTVIDFGEAGSFITDEPADGGGTNEGRRRCRR